MLEQAVLVVEPVGLERMVAIVGPAAGRVVELRTDRGVYRDAVLRQDFRRMGTGSVASGAVDQRRGAELVLDHVTQGAELRALDLARQVAGERVMLGELLVERRID